MNEENEIKINRVSEAEKILSQINGDTQRGDLRKIAKTIKKNHELAMELWETGIFLPRLLAILIMDKKMLSQEMIDKLTGEIQNHPFEERNNLMDWLMSNQLIKDKKTIALMESWENSPFALQRRLFWYYQARLRWSGKTFPENTSDLLSALETNLNQEEPEVQWAMNLTAGWIGIYDEQNRTRCIQLGKRTGLYKDEKVTKGCTPNYLPEFIAIEVNKREKA